MSNSGVFFFFRIVEDGLFTLHLVLVDFWLLIDLSIYAYSRIV